MNSLQILDVTFKERRVIYASAQGERMLGSSTFLVDLFTLCSAQAEWDAKLAEGRAFSNAYQRHQWFDKLASFGTCVMGGNPKFPESLDIPQRAQCLLLSA